MRVATDFAVLLPTVGLVGFIAWIVRKTNGAPLRRASAFVLAVPTAHMPGVFALLQYYDGHIRRSPIAICTAMLLSGVFVYQALRKEGRANPTEESTLPASRPPQLPQEAAHGQAPKSGSPILRWAGNAIVIFGAVAVGLFAIVVAIGVISEFPKTEPAQPGTVQAQAVQPARRASFQQAVDESWAKVFRMYPQLADEGHPARTAFNSYIQEVYNDPRVRSAFDDPRWPVIVAGAFLVESRERGYDPLTQSAVARR